MAYTPATEELIRALQLLPGIGTRSATRMALYLLERDTDSARQLSHSLADALEKVHRCPSCRTLTELPVCPVCESTDRNTKLVCVVANDADRSAIEMSNRFTGRYFVLHGVLSPMDAVGPEQLGVFDLVDKVKAESIEEIMFVLDDQMESEATIYYITEQLKGLNVKCSRAMVAHLKNGSLDQAESRHLVSAIEHKREINIEQK
ncbi:recombination mediator RecR [Reinekea marinisedimentorum]|uniref:Recombination protein RecR n=1 Tax=Reinekea marinisedimentorum TaxID=230495 RepID=A0A4R3IA71_9GAMM|nr:recombination mediator RecR [Reinekea marinisedimentorum]TCS42054.1 DNA replication and repair protein RecR [Reinekea marinisedimentorum]